MSDRTPATVDFDSLLIPKLELDRIIGKDLHEKLAVESSHIGKGKQVEVQGLRRSGIGTGILKTANVTKAGAKAFNKLLSEMRTLNSNKSPVAKITRGVVPKRTAIDGKTVKTGVRSMKKPPAAPIAGRGNVETYSGDVKTYSEGVTNRNRSPLTRFTERTVKNPRLRKFLTTDL